jgi:tRNA 2-thiouridine synthesizing protein A
MSANVSSQVETNADLFLDCKNLLCPMPIIKLSQAIKKINVGQTILIETTDPGSQYDIDAWARQTGQEVLLTDHKEKIFRFLIRRAR